MRAISTVLDVSLCLLLVTASALTLVGTPLEDETIAPDTADEAVEVLTTTTARVTYDVGERNRTTHDTLAGLLATAALADADSAGTTAFERVAAERVNRTLTEYGTQSVRATQTVRATQASPTSRGIGIQVIADPTEDSDSVRDGRLVAGASPPPDADLQAAAFEVRRVRLTVRTWSR